MAIEKCLNELKKHLNLETATEEDVNIDYETINTNEEFFKMLSIKSLRRSLQQAVKVNFFIG